MHQHQSIEDIEREDMLRTAAPLLQADRQCRIALAADWRADQPERLRVVSLEWNPGGPTGRTSIILLKPGSSVIQPLWKAESWFGPFSLPGDFHKAQSEREKQFYRERYAEEKTRALNRYDYERPRKFADGIEPIGPHRFPDVTVTILDEVDDPANPPQPIRLHALYKIGEFDVVHPMEKFGQRESIDDVKVRYEAELDAAAAVHQSEMTRLETKMAEVAGMVKGLAVGVAASQKSSGAASPAPEATVAV